MIQTASPDYDALASEVVRLMVTLRPPHPPRPFPEEESDCPLSPSATSPAPDAPAAQGTPPNAHLPHPPAIPHELLEVGRGSVGVLGVLSHSGGQATPGRIGQMTGLSKGRVSNIVRALEEKGYVEKRPCPTDSRSVTVVLSEKGRQVTDQHRSHLHAHVAAMLRQLGPQDAEDGVRVMRHLAQILEANRHASSQSPVSGGDGE